MALQNLIIITSLVLFSLISFYRTNWGIYLILLLLPSFLIRTQIWFVPTTFLELAIYLIAIIWLVKKIRNWKLEIGNSIILKLKIHKPFILPAAILIIAALISTLISPDKRLSLGILKGWFFDPLLFAIILINQIKTSKHINNVVASLGLMAFWVSSYGIYEYFTHPQNLIEKLRLDSIFTSANYVTMLIVPIMILAIGWGISTIKQSDKLLHYYIVALLVNVVTGVAAIYLTRSYSGWFALGAGLLALGFFYPAKWQKKLAVILILAVCFGLFLYAQKNNPKFKALADFNGRTAVHTRLQIWQTSLTIIKENPILGIGLGNFHEAYLSYLLLTVSSPLEYNVIKPHNLYFNLWIEAGLLGLIAFLWLIVVFYKHSFKNKKIGNWRLAAGNCAALTALLAQGLFDTPYFKNDLSILFWVLVGLAIILRRGGRVVEGAALEKP